MCTVSIVPTNAGLVFTFNRDENPQRRTPHFMQQKTLLHKNIFFSQDVQAGGTWFAVDDCGNAAMLFNGGFMNHTRLETYSKSRGMILLDLIAAVDMRHYFTTLSLQDVQPFSILLFQESKLYRLTWDGIEKHIEQLSCSNSYIFSSATLYSKDVQQKRQLWLSEFLQKNSIPNAETVFEFHKSYNAHDKQNGLVITRENSCSTLSISQASIGNNKTFLKHLDLNTGQQFLQTVLHT
jgi:succinate dehydrogenase flavin-adding protein (antitoxin of CptAB toxin-antitoxin module)